MRVANVVAALIFILAGCTRGAPDSAADSLGETRQSNIDTAAVRQAIDSTAARMTAGINRQDVATMAEGLAEDYTSLESPEGMVRGKAAYRAGIDSMAATGTWHDLAYEGEGLDVSGDLAVRYGRYRLKFLPKGADTVRFAGNFVHVWRRQADGSWKLAREISNSAVPLPNIGARR